MTSGANTIPVGDLLILSGSIPAGSTAGCIGGALGCGLSGTPQTLFTNGPTTGTAEFSYGLQLEIPNGQAPGAYTGGLLTFTATA
jgi:hypothetical protein